MNIEKANIFSLGATLLECIILESVSQQIYKNYTVDYMRVESIINYGRSLGYS